MDRDAELAALGWTADRGPELAALGADLEAARVVVELRGQPQVSSGAAPFAAVLGGALRHKAGAGERPAIGDWVALRREGDGPATIHRVLPRRSALVRLASSGRPQVLAANVDLAVVVMGLDGDYNLRRLERYLALTTAAGVPVAIALSKADQHADATARAAEVAAAAGRAALAVAAHDLRDGAAAAWLAPWLAPGKTLVLLGSSGAGKSTLTNALFGGAVQRTSAVRAHDQRGVHTTTHRELFALPGGALAIDTPGIRALALADGEGADLAFDDVLAIAAGCQFRDCRHAAEPGCAVVAAVVAGALDAARLASFRKLAEERSSRRKPGGGRPAGGRPERTGKRRR